MNRKIVFSLVLGAAALGLGMLSSVTQAHWDPTTMTDEQRQQMMDQGYGMGPGMMGQGTMGHGTMGHGTMGHGTMGHGTMGHGTMGHGTMGHGMMGHGMMGPGMMGPGMMGPEMMGPGMMGPEMMGPGTMGHGLMGHGLMGHGLMGHGMGLVWMLDLTEEQRTQIREIQDEQRRQTWNTMGKIIDESSQLRHLYDADKWDPNAIGAVYGKIFDLKRQMIEASIAAHNRREAVLTQEQRDQLTQWHWGMLMGGEAGSGGCGPMHRGMMNQ